MNEEDFENTLKRSKNFQLAPRIENEDFNYQVYRDFVLNQCIPIVVSNSLAKCSDQDRSIFNLEFLRTNYYHLQLEKSIRDVEALVDLKGTLGSYIDYLVRYYFLLFLFHIASRCKLYFFFTWCYSYAF